MTTSEDTDTAPLIDDSQPRLSPEICERIIDHLDPNSWLASDERQTLLNCALVCRGWYAESRTVLFEEPSLRTRKDAIVYMRSLIRIPLLGTRARRLEISRRYSEPVMTGPELASILVMLAGKLSKLASLTFSHVSFEHCSMRHLAFCCLHELSHIVSLTLHNVELPSASPFLQVICSFPSLQDLDCYSLHWSKSRSMAPLPEHHRMPLRTVTSLGYDLSCFEEIGHVLLGLLDQATLTALELQSQVSPAALTYTQDMLDIAGRKLEDAKIALSALGWEDTDGDVRPLLLHPMSFEANVNLQTLLLTISTEELNDLALFVHSVLPPLLRTISSKHLKQISFTIHNASYCETDAMLNAFDQAACAQIDELLAEGDFAKLRDVLIHFELEPAADTSQRVDFFKEIYARFPKLNEKIVLIIQHNGYKFPSKTERVLKAKKLLVFIFLSD